MADAVRKDWEVVPLSSIIAELESGVSVNSEDRPGSPGEPGVLKVSAVSDGQFIPAENKAIVPADQKKVTIYPHKGDLLISRANTYDLIAACGLVDRDYPGLFLPDKLWRVVLHDPLRDDMLWLMHTLNSPEIRNQLKARASGTSGSMKNISKEAFLGIYVNRPSRKQQTAIARVLCCWDVAGRTLGDLISAKFRVKQALMQQLLTGKRRLREFEDRAWTKTAFDSFLVESRDRGSDGAVARKLTVRLYGKGVCPKNEARSGSSATQYYLRRAGQLIYSKLDFLNGAFGIVPPELDGHESTLDLPAFNITEVVDSRWLLYFVTRERFYRGQLGLAHGGRKARRVNPRDFLRLKIALPARAEQSRIADVLATADAEIRLLRQELDAIKQQKKGLLQKLLTGQVRVKMPEGGA